MGRRPWSSPAGWLARSQRFFKELRPNVLVPLKTPITPEAAAALAVPLRRGNLTIVSAFGRDDVDAVQKLATAAGDRLEPIESLVESIRTESFERFRNQTVIVVGHVENGAFVTRDAAGRKVSSIDIAELEQLATRSDTHCSALAAIPPAPGRARASSMRSPIPRWPRPCDSRSMPRQSPTCSRRSQRRAR